MLFSFSTSGKIVYYCQNYVQCVYEEPLPSQYSEANGQWPFSLLVQQGRILAGCLSLRPLCRLSTHEEFSSEVALTVSVAHPIGQGS